MRRFEEISDEELEYKKGEYLYTATLFDENDDMRDILVYDTEEEAKKMAKELQDIEREKGYIWDYMRFLIQKDCSIISC